jgi:uncharacterized membrane protein YgcG
MEAARIYKEMGVAALFIVMYVVTVWFLIRLLIADKKKAEEKTERMINVVNDCTNSNEQVTDAVKEMNKALEANTQHQIAFLTYQKARDEARRNN